MRYRLEQYIGGEWWPFGTYSSAEQLAKAAFVLGSNSYVARIRVVEVQDV